jgi:HlyD family secretion protein
MHVNYRQVSHFILGFFCVICLISCKEKSKETVQEKSFIVREEVSTEKLYFSGEIKPIREAAVSVPSDAMVKKMLFNFGDSVKENQALLILNSPTQQKEYDDALTSYLKAKDDLDIAEAKFSGTQSLWKAGLVSENSFKSDKSALFTNKITLLQAKAKLTLLAKRLKGVSTDSMLELSLSDFDRVQTLLDKDKNKIILHAPYDGIALLPPKKDDSHELRVGSQLKSSDVVALVGDVSGLAVTIKIPEINIDKIKKGMKAEITGIAFPGFTLSSVVQSINAQANSSAGDSGGLPVFTAKVVVPTLSREQKAVVKMGMSASVHVILQEKSRMMIPIKAVRLDKGKIWVKRKDKQGVVTNVEVTTGISTSDSVQVLSGLLVGEQLIWSQ